MGRVVITHSSYIKGLLPWLKCLAKEDGIKTVTPATIKRVRGRSPTLQLRLSTTTRAGYKLIARLGSTAQEVFVVTHLEEQALIEKINNSRLRP